MLYIMGQSNWNFIFDDFVMFWVLLKLLVSLKDLFESLQIQIHVWFQMEYLKYILYLQLFGWVYVFIFLWRCCVPTNFCWTIMIEIILIVVFLMFGNFISYNFYCFSILWFNNFNGSVLPFHVIFLILAAFLQINKFVLLFGYNKLFTTSYWKCNKKTVVPQENTLNFHIFFFADFWSLKQLKMISRLSVSFIF
jgi:hypothetical protein